MKKYTIQELPISCSPCLPPKIPVSNWALEFLLSSAYFLTSIYTSLLFLDIFTSIASSRTDSNSQTSFHEYTWEFIPNVSLLPLFRRQSLYACSHLPFLCEFFPFPYTYYSVCPHMLNCVLICYGIHFWPG